MGQGGAIVSEPRPTFDMHDTANVLLAKPLSLTWVVLVRAGDNWRVVGPEKLPDAMDTFQREGLIHGIENIQLVCTFSVDVRMSCFIPNGQWRQS